MRCSSLGGTTSAKRHARPDEHYGGHGGFTIISFMISSWDVFVCSGNGFSEMKLSVVLHRLSWNLG